MSLHARSSLVSSDGSRISANNIRLGNFVLGLDAEGAVSATKVISVRKSGLTSDWVNVKTSRHETALGSAHYSLICTPDQDVLNFSGHYTPMKTILVDQHLQGVSSTLNLDHTQKSILVGILLGDGSIHKGSSSGAGWSVRWSHSSKQEEYMRWTVDILGSLAALGHRDVSGYGSDMLTARTSHHPDLRDLFYGYDKPSGVLPESLLEYMNPISLALWYMDDGSLTHHEKQQDRASFATYSFSDASIEMLCQGLLRMGIKSKVQNSSKGSTIRLNYQFARLMFTMIAPLIPPSMQYKLPLDLRGGPGWMPRSEMIAGYRNASLRTLQVQSLPLRSQKIDIQTTLGNAYVNGVLLRT